MEVHHHPDLHHKRKKFREYFLEFFMIFLAVTMGFFAESIREHYVETRNTRQYLETFKQELINNKRVFVSADSVYRIVVPCQDSIIRIFLEKRENQALHIINYYAISRVQITSDMRLIDRLTRSNDHLTKMVNEILDN